MDGPLVDWGWVAGHLDDIVEQTLEHVQLTVIAVLVGLAIALPLALLAHGHRSWYPPITWATGLLYTIPGLALFAFLVPYTGLTVLTAEIGLVSYTLLILVRNIYVGLQSVEPEVTESARAMGYTPRQLLVRVELPLALPAIVAGVRIATVTTIGLVTVAALIGKGGLGYFILLGIRQEFATASLLGAVLSMGLAALFELLLLGAQRRAMPWGAMAAGGPGA